MVLAIHSLIAMRLVVPLIFGMKFPERAHRYYLIAMIRQQLVNIPIGFVFQYYGTDYSQLSISNNGLILSSATPGLLFTNEQIKSSSQVHGFIAPFWDDLVTSDANTADAIYYETVGTSPNRRFVIEWHDNYRFGESPPTYSGITFEAYTL